ncbi:MAG: ABC transporter ATP-binding protein [Pelolinea sp.]|jgi:ABC-2 type transport system ATP-binding protein|nr:ABC transporter ATP-binding protein [Pelolinea sp.]
MENAVEVKGLKKFYKDVKAVNGVDFSIQSGEIFSLLGPNGAGKTTTINVLTGLFPPNAGDALIFGHSIKKEPLKAKALMGVVPQEIALYEDLSARENLVFWGKLYGLRGKQLQKRVDEVLELIGLRDRQRQRISKYSGGMKRRVNIGIALLHLPKLVIMDEPTVGIDPQSRRHILDNVLQLNKQGMTVLYTTHYMEEAQELSSHIAIMDQGRIVANGTHAELVKLVGEQDRVELALSQDGGKVLKEWKKVKGVSKVDQEGEKIVLLVNDSNAVLPELFKIANQQNARIASIAIHEPNLETVFLHLTGKALRD